ncbi:MAG TPA: phosphoglucosamine mutase [Gammaproteobacteria bacterium]|nr:phosphoglucosamine mutase [Gammaproteobacteria bacterium]
MGRRYFGTDGIRGRVGRWPITPEFVLKLGWAAGKVLGGGEGGKVLIGKDTRISGYLFESALEAGLTAAGVHTRMLGPMPTPGIAYLTRTLHADAGIVISASHNPHHDNGIKFFSSTGQKLPDEVEAEIEAMIDQPMDSVSSERLGKVVRIEDARGRYIEFCKATIPSRMNFQGMKIVVDCAHGATYHIAPDVFEEIGAEVVAIGVQPDGLNINDGCGATAPEALQRRVLEEGADLGIALDGDGDRLIMVDHEGRIRDGDDILYVLARSRQRTGEMQGQVVGTQMSNLGLELALQALGMDLCRVKVGDRYIMERLAAENWLLGGEPSGHIICLDRTSTGDGIVSALQVLAEMHATGQSLAELCDGIEKYPQVLVNVDLGEQAPAAVMQSEPVNAAVADVERRLNGQGRVLLRPSGTEPKIRVMVEGPDDSTVRAFAEEIAEAVRGVC